MDERDGAGTTGAGRVVGVPSTMTGRVPASGLGGLRGLFAATDVFRRTRGDVLQALGFGPNELPFRVIDSGPHWRLRDYEGPAHASAVLIVAAPIKRPYVWDLSPSVSAIRFLRARRLHLYLLEWRPVSWNGGGEGVAEHVRAIARCVGTISGETGGAKPVVIGHSLGGTLAAIFGTVAADRIRSLALLGAPLCFAAGSSPFRDALVSLVPAGLSDAGPCPGSLLSYLSAMASPNTFIWSRLADAAFAATDREVWEAQARVQRWALDEVALPGRLVCQLVEELYRQDRLCKGTLNIGGAVASPVGLSVPTLFVVNSRDEIAPLASMTPFMEAMPTSDVRVIEHQGEPGVGLQHLALLIGRRARAEVWPAIAGWLETGADRARRRKQIPEA